MAYNNGYTPQQTYPTYYSGQNSYYSQQQQYQPQLQPQQASNGSIMTVQVNSEEDVNMYPLAAGTTVLLISFEKQKFWIKSRGTDGVPLPVRTFPFKEEVNTLANNQNGAVTREEFNQLNSKLNKLLEELGGVKNE